MNKKARKARNSIQKQKINILKIFTYVVQFSAKHLLNEKLFYPKFHKMQKKKIIRTKISLKK
jgi:hypothetical protein